MLNEDVLWNAVTDRNAQWDGVFVYGVPSTKIYCRPTCPSRRPRRAGVQFFPAPTLATAAGYRACKRCKPDGPVNVPPALERVRRACAALARADERVTLTDLARTLDTNPFYLLRSFKKTLGVTPREYADACRMGCLKERLRDSHGVADATYAAGFGSGSRVYERSGSTLGMTPAVYASGGAGERVRYATADTSLGRLLVAATPRGICSVTLGDADTALVAALQREYPRAAVAAADRQLQRWVRSIVESIERDVPDPRLPLDVRATAFQRRVWNCLQRIPRGKTMTYGEVAERVGAPGSARAVARACASNPTALVVPCHRVVGANGALSGYRWGVERKAALLRREAGRGRR